MNDLADLSMLDLFRIEAENYTKILEAGLVQVENDQTPEKIEPLMRAAHSIKGAARIVGLDNLVALAHGMEDVLSAAQKGRMRLMPHHIDLLLQSNDILLHLASLDPEMMAEWLDGQLGTIGVLSQTLRAALEEGPAVTPAPVQPVVQADPSPAVARDRPRAPLEESAGSQGEREGEAHAARPGEGATLPAGGQAPLRGQARAPLTDDSSVRVVSGSLNRLMGLAGECLVQAKSAKPFSTSLLSMKELHMELATGLETVYQSIQRREVPKEVKERFEEALRGLDRVRDLIHEHIEGFEFFSRNLERLADKLYGEVVEIRMRPFSDGLPGFPRMVRDLAKNLGKKITLTVLGESTRVDRDILEKLEAPLTHLLRNAADHGLETPDERRGSGKSEEGSIVLEARHSSGMLHIRVADDGRGVDLERLRTKVVKDGRVSGEMAATLSDGELLDFLFLPGFSTAAKVTEVSGRGVGLDVVMSMVQEVGGSIRAESQLGKGTSFNLYLPLTLSVLRALLVDIGGEPYAIPLARIDRIMETGPEHLRILEDKQFCSYGNDHIGVVDAHQVLQTPVSDRDPEGLCIAIISDRLNRYGLVVKRFLGERELVVIPLDPRLGRIPNISAGAVLEDGSPVLILDVDDLVRSIDNLLTHGRLHKVGDKKEYRGAAKKRVLVVDDSLTVREVERRLLENSGYEVIVGVDGMDGWNLLQEGRFDLVISDVDMPRMNGIDLIRKIKGDARLRETPVIIVSYKDREEDRLKGLEAGANYYLTKSSFNDDSLTGAVRDMIGEP
jgi:two-component system sensor histidine kinase and response regulator WspE